jgi:dipeptidyl aminopeptidase/acylaminoacyl peptidase
MMNLLRALLLTLILGASLQIAAQSALTQRSLQPEDLFRVRHVGETAWSPDGRYAAIEFSRAGQTLDGDVPTNEGALLDVQTRIVHILSSNGPTYIGFFNARWSPDGRRLAFLSVDTSATVRPWVWTTGGGGPALVHDLDVNVGFNESTLVWVGNGRLALVAWDAGAAKSGDLRFRILRGRNVADEWRHAIEGKQATVSVLESGRSASASQPSARLVALDLRTNATTTLARGLIHRLSLSADGRFLTFLREEPGIPGPVASYLARANVEEAYAAVNWGAAQHAIDLQSGAEVAPSSVPIETTRATLAPTSTGRPRGLTRGGCRRLRRVTRRFT